MKIINLLYRTIKIMLGRFAIWLIEIVTLKGNFKSRRELWKMMTKKPIPGY